MKWLSLTGIAFLVASAAAPAETAAAPADTAEEPAALAGDVASPAAAPGGSAAPPGPAAFVPAPVPVFSPGEWWVAQDDWQDGPESPGEREPVPKFGRKFRSQSDLHYKTEGVLTLAPQTGGFIKYEELSLPGLGGEVRSLKLSRVDGDGYLDLVAATKRASAPKYRADVWINGGVSPPVFTYEGPAFTSDAVQDHPIAVCTGDFNNDDRTDVAYLGALRASICLRKPTENGWVTPPVQVDLTSFLGILGDIVPAEVDHNDDMDLAVAMFGAGQDQGRLVCLRNLGSRWEPLPLDTEQDKTKYIGLAAADFDGDGDDDFVATGPKWTAFFETVSGTTLRWNRTAYPADAGFKAAVGDFNGDGWPDAAVSNVEENGKRIVVYINKKQVNSLGFDRYVVGGPSSTTFIELATLDLNKDNYDDLAVGHGSRLEWGYSDGQSPPGFDWKNGGEGADPFTVDAGDLDDDGDGDLVTGNLNSTEQVHWFEFEFGYAASGNLVSSVLDTAAPATDYAQVKWTADENGGQVEVRARTDNSPSMLNALPWEYCLPLAPGPVIDGAGIRDGDRYFQYRLKLVPAAGASPSFHKIRLQLSGSDDEGPVTSNLTVLPEPVETASEVRLRALVSDAGTGNNLLTEAEYFLDGPPGEGGSGLPLEPEDGQWDSSSESVVADLPTAGWGDSGTHTVYVRGRDAPGYWGEAVSYTFQMGDVAFFPADQCFVYPNPVTGGELRVRYFVSKDASVKLEVFDLRGRLVTSLQSEAAGYTDNYLTLDVSALAPDVYFYRATATASATGERETVGKKFAVIK